jgi:hypothetical protein
MRKEIDRKALYFIGPYRLCENSKNRDRRFIRRARRTTTFDVVTCEYLTRTEYDGTVTVLMDKFDGKPLNSPNDIVVKSDDTDLVHRSAVWDFEQLRWPGVDARIAYQRLPAR